LSPGIEQWRKWKEWNWAFKPRAEIGKRNEARKMERMLSLSNPNGFLLKLRILSLVPSIFSLSFGVNTLRYEAQIVIIT
jgi:hypothetical protein